jgi:hypothetical protein
MKSLDAATDSNDISGHEEIYLPIVETLALSLVFFGAELLK